MGQSIWHILTTDKHFEPFLFLLDPLVGFVGPFYHEAVFFGFCRRTRMIEEGNWVPESNVTLLAAAPIFFVDERKAFAYVVQVLRAFYNRLKKVIFD